MPSYALDQDAARKAGTVGRITATGRYLGTLTHAWFEESENHAHALKFKFKAIDGATAEVAVWTHNKEGKPLSGFNLLQALMTCLKLRKLESVRGQVPIYDRREKKDVEQVREVYPDLTGKPIGLFLEAEISKYTDDHGNDAEYTRMVLAAPFRAEDGKMAGEILDQKPKAEQADKYEVYLLAKKPRTQDRREKPGERDERGVYGGQTGSYANQGGSGGGFDDDDIPF